MTPPNDPTRCALYARVSGREQVEAGTSLEVQEERLRAYAAGMGWEVAGVYIEEAESGAKESRPELNRLWAAAKAGEFSKIVVVKLDRWSRSSLHLQKSIKDFLKYRVALVSVTETIDFSTPSGRAMLSVMGTFAELERETIRDRTLTGRRQRAQEGMWPGGNAPFGFRIVDRSDPAAVEWLRHVALVGASGAAASVVHAQVHHETRSAFEGTNSDSAGETGRKRSVGKVAVHHADEAATVRRAVTLLLDESMTTGQIASTLNAEKRFRKTGVRWTHGTLTRMLRNDALIGHYTFARAEPTDEASRHPQRDRRRFVIVRDEETGRQIDRDVIPKGMYGEPIEIKLPPIVGDDVFEAVQKKLDARALGPRSKPNRTYSLSGVLFFPCSHEPAGSRAHGIWRDQGGPEGVRRMRCINNKTNAAHPQKCDCPSLMEEPLASAVWAAVVDLVADPDFLTSLAEERLARLGESDPARTVLQLDARIAAQETKMAADLMKLLDGGFDAAVVGRVRGEMQSDLDILRARREEAAEREAARASEEATTDRLAKVGQAGRERLLGLDDRQRAEVYSLLDLRVDIVDFGRPNGPTADRCPPTFSLSGRLTHSQRELLLSGSSGASRNLVSAGDLATATSASG